MRSIWRMRPERTLPGPTSMKWVARLGGEELDALDPADGAGDLADEGSRGTSVPRVRRRASTLAATGKAGSWKVMASRSAARASCAGCMRAQWKGALTWSMTVRLAPACFAEVGGALDGGGGAGDDGLVGGVEVGGGDDGAVLG